MCLVVVVLVFGVLQMTCFRLEYNLIQSRAPGGCLQTFRSFSSRRVDVKKPSDSKAAKIQIVDASQVGVFNSRCKTDVSDR